jgi:anaerobic magnesium-protoporphyrin IX monomethyl ester cyclase
MYWAAGEDGMSTVPDVDLVSLRFGRDAGKSPPIGLLYLGASLNAAGVTWSFNDCQTDPRINAFDVNALGARLCELEAPILALSVFNDAIPLVIAVLDAFADELASRRIFIGGPGVVGIAGPLMERLPQVEAIVVGEGETALPLLAKHQVTPGSMVGIWMRDEHGVVRGQGRTPREDLDRFESLPWSVCRGHNYSRIPLSTMRGCPFDCEFCEIIAFMGRKVSMRALGLSFADLSAASAHIRSREVDVLDDTFTVNSKRVHAFCAGLNEREERISFSIYSRVDTIDRATMEFLREVGCTRVFFGIDSADDTVLTRISKRIQIADVLPILRQAAEYFDVTASLIWGFPFESLKAFDATMAFAEACREQASPHRIQPQLHLLSPSAGTPLFDTYGDRLVLDEAVEGTTSGTLAMNAWRADYDTILQVIRTNPVLAAPFYRYDTPHFGAKADRVRAFSCELDVEVGRRAEALLTGD